MPARKHLPRIRMARPDDAAAALALVEWIDRETRFLPREPGERPVWCRSGDPAAGLAAFLARGNAALFLATADDDDDDDDGGAAGPLGYLSAAGGTLAGNRGVATLSLGVRAGWQGQGLGTRLIAAAEEWARGAGLHRLELTVAVPNRGAHALYRGLGFADEGCMRDALRVDGAFRDERVMGKPLTELAGPVWPPLDLDALPPGPVGEVRVRLATAADAVAYHAFDQAVRTETPFLPRRAAEGLADPAAARRFLAGQRPGAGVEVRALTLVAVAGSPAGASVLGALSLRRHAGRRMAHDGAVTLAVRREWWGSGLGTRLLEAALAEADRAGLHRLSGWVTGHNARARRFAAAHGFAEEAVCPRHALIDGRWADHVLLARLL